MEKAAEKSVTVAQAVNNYITVRSNTLSPLTIRGYRIIEKNRFQFIMPRILTEIKPDEWQRIVNREAGKCSPKTPRNAWGLIRSGLGMLRKGILRLEESADREQLRTLALRARHLRAYVGYEKAGQDAEGTWFLLDDINTIAYQVLQDTCGLCVKRGAEAQKCPLQKALRSCTTLHDDRQIDGCVFKPYTDSNYFGLLDEHSETVSD
jgi:hypothetical protein